MSLANRPDKRLHSRQLPEPRTPKPLNQCGNCGEDFTSVEGFDKHRVGTFDYTFTQGLDMSPPRENGRRCLGVDEIAALGYERNTAGRWYNPAKARTAREFFAASRLSRDVTSRSDPSP